MRSIWTVVLNFQFLRGVWGVGVCLCQCSLSSAQGCDLHISICGQPQCAHCHAHCSHAVLSPCASPDVCHLAEPTPICSTLWRGWWICLPPGTQTHTLSRAGCVPCSSQLSAAHPLCTSQPGCITSLVCNNNFFQFQNNLALLGTTSLISKSCIISFLSYTWYLLPHSSRTVLSQASIGIRICQHLGHHKMETNGQEGEAGCEITYLDNCGVYIAASAISGKPMVRI